MSSLQWFRFTKITIFGRSLLIVILEVFANALFWFVAGILFGKNDDSRPVLNLALLAWVCIANLSYILAIAQQQSQTLGLRHGTLIMLS